MVLVKKRPWPFRSWDTKICFILRMVWWNELVFACWCKYRKAKSYLGGHGQNGGGFIDHGTLKSGVYHKWFDELSWLIECFCMLIVMEFCFWFDGQSTPYLWHLNPGGPLQVHLAKVFRKNSLWSKMTPK